MTSRLLFISLFLPALASAAQLVCEPATLRVIAGQRVHIVVTEKADDGSERDATDEATVSAAEAAKVTAQPGGVVRGVAAGSTTLVLSKGDLRAEVPVEVLAPPQEPPTFVRDVLPVLSRAGCAAGACHAKAEGQNGFRQSVFSFDPRSDWHEIVRAARGRRVFPAAPEESLLLLKAAQLVPHEGGERIPRGSDAWRTVVQWIGSGLTYQMTDEATLARVEVFPKARAYRKGARQRLIVRAHFTDGAVRDVTDLAAFSANEKGIATVDDDGVVTVQQTSGQAVVVARYMGLVDDAQIVVPTDHPLPPEAFAALPPANFIDELAFAKLRELGLPPSAPCSDGDFLRRATLDVTGLLPTAEQARAFLADTGPDKRARAVDRLLADPAYADHWATKWADLLRPNPDRVGVKSTFLLDEWIRSCFRQNLPLDRFAREILLCQGNTHRDGPAVIYRDRREPAELTTMFSQIFLGVRLECAKCHHHPNEKWSQEDFYRMAAFFAPLKQKGGGISAPISGGNETFYVSTGAVMKHPVTGAKLDPQPPDGPRAGVGDGDDPRTALVDWMFDAKNPQFARAMANRIWAQFFGRGIVDPVDDFRVSNPASHPALLDALAQEFIRVRYDSKSLMRTVLNSRLYQLASEPNGANAADTRHFSRAYRRRLGAEAMADALDQLTGVPGDYPGLPDDSRAAQAWTYKIESRTMDAFGRPNSSSDCPCERNMKPAMAQSLHLMNSTQLQARLTSEKPDALVTRLAARAASPGDVVTELYLACYSRFPTPQELVAATAPFSEDPATRRPAIEDVLWALVNSAEFVFNH